MKTEMKELRLYPEEWKNEKLIEELKSRGVFFERHKVFGVALAAFIHPNMAPYLLRASIELAISYPEALRRFNSKDEEVLNAWSRARTLCNSLNSSNPLRQWERLAGRIQRQEQTSKQLELNFGEPPMLLHEYIELRKKELAQFATDMNESVRDRTLTLTLWKKLESQIYGGQESWKSLLGESNESR
jgi:hypothetical protein